MIRTAVAAASLLGASTVLAQQPAADPAPPSPALVLRAVDAVGMLIGNFSTDPAVGGHTARGVGGGESPVLTMNSAPIAVAGLENAIYFEIARADDAQHPFRQGVFNVYLRDDAVRLRVFDLADGRGQPAAVRANCDLPGALAHLWRMPDEFPPLSLAQLRPNTELVLSDAPGADGGFVSVSPAAVLSSMSGAVEMESEVRLTPEEFSTADRGMNSQGRQVWGPVAGEMHVFRRINLADTSLSATPEGVLLIDIVKATPEDGSEREELVEGGTISVHYSGWLVDGYLFDSSRLPGREPFTVQIPGQLIEGWNQGLIGLAEGDRRRLIIPPELGYGDRGAPRGNIPPNAVLIFEIECLSVQNPAATPPGAPEAETEQDGIEPERTDEDE